MLNLRRCRCVVTCAGILFAAPGVFGQDISGRVVDSDTRAPLPGVNVYISGTTLGAATLDDGSFVIHGSQAGRQDLVASMVGYKPVVRAVDVPPGGLRLGLIEMTEDVLAADEVLITAEQPRDWHRHFERFSREFVGTSQNADDCKILNPYVLDFEPESATKRLSASAPRPLQIENRALGYRISFLLEDFEVANWTYSIRFRGRPRFEELEPATNAERERWERNRRATYLGSLQHFLFSLVRGSADSEGFELRLGDVESSTAEDLRLLPRANPDSLLVGGMTSFERLFYTSTPLHVIYREEAEPKAYQRFMTEVTGARYMAHGSQHSVLVFDRGVTLHTSGYLYEPYAVTTYGYWVWERVADMLPRDYKPAGGTSLSTATDG